jgi:ribosomal 50S subunit-recycling heat shock protein
MKTRSGAARLISDGKVRINGERALKPTDWFTLVT